jgi:hypothetical protein
MDVKFQTLLFILLIIAFLFFFIYPLIHPKVNYLTNTTELYSSFTPYMQDWVNFYLQAINCEQKKYYYLNESVCFACQNFDACFGYAYVNRSEGVRMNPMGKPLLSTEMPSIIFPFYSFGVTNIINCSYNQKEMECLCENGIKAKMIEDHTVILTFPEDVDINQTLKDVTDNLGFKKCDFRNMGFACEVVEFYFLPSFEVRIS